jgi:hypothetical protein
MAITKQQLKSIVKECLVEILAEGMGASTASSINEASRKSNKPAMHHSTILRQSASKTTLGASRQPTEALREAIRRESAGNSVMADILRDTATTTLPSMLEGETRSQPAVHGLTERMVANHDPEELFGEEVTSKWADLAFMSSPKR